MLLENFARQRLQAKTFKRFFFKRVFSTFFAKRSCSICCFFARRASFSTCYCFEILKHAQKVWVTTCSIWVFQRACIWYWRACSFCINHWQWRENEKKKNCWWISNKRWWVKISIISTKFEKQWQRKKNHDIAIMIW